MLRVFAISVFLLSVAVRAEEFTLVQPGYTFVFPRDYGSHPEYPTEWWYFTGHLRDQTERDFGFELTFFRVGVTPEGNVSKSIFAVQSIYLAHFAITDDQGQRFYFTEKFSRGALGEAGAEREALHVWLGEWSVRGEQVSDSAQQLIKLSAQADFGRLSLDLRVQKDTVLHGDRGVSTKGPGAGNASLYMSHTRMSALGKLQLGDKVFEVSGAAWMDHEVLSSKLDRKTLGWDWFAVQLADGSEVMLYQLRYESGAVSTYSAGTVVSAAGAVQHLKAEDFKIEVLNFWQSSKTGIRYPSRWRLTIPREDLSLIVVPTVAEQELITNGSTGVSYWEGRALVQGERSGRKVLGAAYVELVGYKAVKAR